MSEEYILAREIIHDHSARMMNIKKYYPYFKLIESDFSSFQGGKYESLDMGYIFMAVLRFFIEENNFKEKDVTYEEYADFMREIYRRDFELPLLFEEEEEISSYIFDKIRNDGKPFIYQYFDPDEKVKKTVRMRILDSRIRDNAISYYITSDAIEFYLDTKEIKDESTISIAQVLLGKMIESRNFKGGTEVIKRINSEVARLKMRKNDVLAILSQDVFEGTKAYEEFVKTGIRWFDEEQKLFEKNMELVQEAMARAGDDGEHAAAVRDIYELETELKKAILKHSQLLSACTELQMMADEMIRGAKYSRLRRSFDFADALKTAVEQDDTSVIKALIEPMLKLNIRKTFDLKSIDRLLAAPPQSREKGEMMNDAVETEYVYEDLIEEERIEENFQLLIRELLDYILEHPDFLLSEFNAAMTEKYGEKILKNRDYYPMLVHMCQKKHYDIDGVREKPDTFFEEYLMRAANSTDDNRYHGLAFEIETGEGQEIHIPDVGEIWDLRFSRADK